MIQLKKALASSVGQKFLMSISGLGLVAFLVVHLLGNLALYSKDGSNFNRYAHQLDSLGPLKLAAEIGLLVIILMHAALAFRLKLNYRHARPIQYRKRESKAGKLHEKNPSNLASRNMIWTGIILLGFLVMHVLQFRFGLADGSAATTVISGQPMRDLYAMVVLTFKNPYFMALYVAAMLFVGTHLRHGFWSGFQSLGVMSPAASKVIHTFAIFVALILAAGFLFIPVYIYFAV